MGLSAYSAALRARLCIDSRIFVGRVNPYPRRHFSKAYAALKFPTKASLRLKLSRVRTSTIDRRGRPHRIGACLVVGESRRAVSVDRPESWQCPNLPEQRSTTVSVMLENTQPRRLCHEIRTLPKSSAGGCFAGPGGKRGVSRATRWLHWFRGCSTRR